jgi:hypothetical protein
MGSNLRYFFNKTSGCNQRLSDVKPVGSIYIFDPGTGLEYQPNSFGF